MNRGRDWMLAVVMALAPAPALADVEAWERSCGSLSTPPESRIAACDRLIESDGYEDVSWALARRGTAYRQSENYDQAIADYDAAIARDPLNFFAYGERAFVRMRLGDYELAAADMEHLVVSEPDLDWNHYFLGRIYGLQHRREESIAALDRAIALRDDYYPSRMERAWALADAGRNLEAVGDFTAALALRPFSVRGYEGRAHAYEALERWDDAAHDDRIALLIDPDTELSRWRLEGLVQLEGPPALPPFEHIPPQRGHSISYLQVTVPRGGQAGRQGGTDGATPDWISSVLPGEPRALAEMTRTVDAVDGDAVTEAVAVAASKGLSADDRASRSARAYRGLVPLTAFLGAGIPDLQIRLDETALAGLWPLEPGKSVTGTGEYAFVCPAQPDVVMLMIGCARRDRIPLGHLTYHVTVEGTEQIHVPLGVFDTFVLHYREVGTVEFMGRAETREVETRWWFAPEVAHWVRRTERVGDSDVVSEATAITPGARSEELAGIEATR